MSIFSCGFNQSAVLQRNTGISNMGKALYSDDEAFKCCFVYKRREVLSKEGNAETSEATLLTDTEIKPLDHIIYDGRTWTAKTVAKICGLDGRVDHWEVAL